MVVRPGPPSCGNGKLVNEVQPLKVFFTYYLSFFWEEPRL